MSASVSIQELVEKFAQHKHRIDRLSQEEVRSVEGK